MVLFRFVVQYLPGQFSNSTISKQKTGGEAFKANPADASMYSSKHLHQGTSSCDCNVWEAQPQHTSIVLLPAAADKGRK